MGSVRLCGAIATLCLQRWSLLQVLDYLVTILLAVLPARDMYPVIFTIAGFHDELVKVAIVLNPVKPFAGGL